MRKAQVIDLTRSYIPVDPESFYENMMITGQEDAPERLLQIVPYEGYNFLPTVYGYRSFFDTTSQLDVAKLSKKVSHVFLFQLSNYTSHLIALAEDGAYFCDPQTSGATWTKRYNTGSGSEPWSYCVIENNLYIFRAGASSVCKVPFTGTIATPSLVSLVPSFITLTSQLGIFRANGRLGFWDSSNTITWTSLFDFADATPSISTLAASVKFNDILGSIVSVRSFGDGFIIYSTKNIVGAEFNTQGSILFRARAIAESAGIWDNRQCCVGSSDVEQYAYTNSGIKKISGNMQVENIFPSVFDLLKESRDPVFTNLINGRFLFLSTPDPTYIYNKVTYSISDIDSLTIRFLSNGNEVIDINDLPDDINGMVLPDDLEQQVMALSEDIGIYTQWNASGAVMVSGRTPSSMDPYLLDDPSTPGDDHPYTRNLAPLMTADELIAIRDATTPVFVSPMDIDESTPFALDLGWQRAASKGATDITLERFKARQEVEFDDYERDADDLAWVINALSSSSVETWYGNNYYATNVDATAAKPSDVAAVYTNIGQFLSSGPATVETFSGVGTNAPTWEYEKTFNQGYVVEHGIQKSYVTATICYGIVFECYGWMVPNVVENSAISYAVTALDRPIAELTRYINGLGATWSALLSDISIDGSYPILREGITTGLQNVTNTTISTALNRTCTPPNSVWVYDHRYPTVTDLIECPYARVENGFYGQIFYYRYYKDTGGGLITEYDVVGWVSLGGASDCYRIYETKTNNLRAIGPGALASVTAKAQASQRNIEWCNYLVSNPNPDFPYGTNDLTIPLDIPLSPSVLPPYASYTFPGSTFNLQNGALGAAYPNLVGSFVYDIQLQKWGKQKNTFHTLLDYTPINSTVEKIVSFTNLGMDAGIITTDGWTKLFGWSCTDSFIRYGKIGLNRQGFSNIDEIGFNFREPFTGEITIDYSIDGRNLQASLQQVESFLGEGYATVYPLYASRWYTVGISGTFDIRSMTLAATAAGMR